MKYIITESQATNAVKSLFEKHGMKKMSKLTGMDYGMVLSFLGITGTQDDMIYLTKVFMDTEFKKMVKYCSYDITPTRNSFKLDVYLPKFGPEDGDIEKKIIHICKHFIPIQLDKLSNGLIEGERIKIHTTGDC
jgi:hypothetical protein